MKKLIALTIAATLGSTASAGIVLDFSNVPVGASVAEFYNGGFDSTGTHRGPGYGISFTAGAVVGNTSEYGAYAGRGFGSYGFIVSFDPSIARLTDGTGSAISFIFNSGSEDALLEFGGGSTIYRQTVGSSGCTSYEACLKMQRTGVSENYNYFTARFAPDVSTIIFYGLSIDNLAFGVIGPGPQIMPRTEVPEPASMALVGIGLAGLMALRRRALKAD